MLFFRSCLDCKLILILPRSHDDVSTRSLLSVCICRLYYSGLSKCLQTRCVHSRSEYAISLDLYRMLAFPGNEEKPAACPPLDVGVSAGELHRRKQNFSTPIFKEGFRVREHMQIFHKNISEKSGVGKFESM